MNHFIVIVVRSCFLDFLVIGHFVIFVYFDEVGTLHTTLAASAQKCNVFLLLVWLIDTPYSTYWYCSCVCCMGYQVVSIPICLVTTSVYGEDWFELSRRKVREGAREGQCSSIVWKNGQGN